MQPTMTSKQRILFIFESLQQNGASKSLIALLKSIKDEYDISLFLFKRDASAEAQLPDNIRILEGDEYYRALLCQMRPFVLKALLKGKWRLAWFRFRVFIERALGMPFKQWDKMKAIECDCDFAIGYSDGFVSEVIANKVRCGKRILWLHINPMLDPLPAGSLKAMLKVDGVVGVSKDCIANLERLLGADKLPRRFIVHNIINETELKRQAMVEKVELPGKRYKILTVGRLTKEKGHIRIPLILRKLNDRGICADWSIVGTGLASVKASVMSKAEEFGVADHIHFLGARQNPYPYFVAADCYAQTSFAEGWCMTISEAFALGVPVVCNDLPVFHEQIVDGMNGFCAKDDISFAAAIQRVLTSGVTSSRHMPLPFAPECVKAEFGEVIKSLG